MASSSCVMLGFTKSVQPNLPDFFPRYNVIGGCFVLGDSAVKLGPLVFSQRHRTAIRGNAIPKLLNQCQALFDREVFDTQ